MRIRIKFIVQTLALSTLAVATLANAAVAAPADPLPSWRDTAVKTRIMGFVTSTTTTGSPDFVPAAERVAVFDNDGTLWAEQPIYFQLEFALDRVRALASSHPEWKTQQPFQAVLEDDMPGVLAGGTKGLLQLVMASHAGNTTEEFAEIVRSWLATARHPATGQPYTEMVYQPMLELLEYLRANGYKTFIVSGGGIEFLRVFAEDVYGVPPEQVVGSSIATRYEIRDGKPALVREPKMNFLNDGAGKPEGINQHIGRRPVLAFGNSDGDFEMLEWTTAGTGSRLGLLVHHDDAKRETAYDRESSVGRLDRGLDEAGERGWVIVSMRDDWKSVFPARD